MMKRTTWLVAMLLLMVAACSLAPEATPGASPIPATLAPTNEAPLATAPPAPIAPASGTAGFRDQLAVADQFMLALANVSAPPVGQAYQGWLVGDDGSLVNLGVLPVESDGSLAFAWNSPTTENLASRYARLQITLEPAAGSVTPTGPVILAGGLEGSTLTNAQRLFVKNDGTPATPLNTAFALGLMAQTDLAAQHITNAFNAAAIGALPEMRGHLEHVVNILEGAGGLHFGDHDGNHTAENPGDGFGVMGYSAQIAALLAEQTGVLETDANIQTQSDALQSRCLEILALQDAGVAASQLAELQKTANQFKTGLVAELYQAAQATLTFAVAPVK